MTAKAFLVLISAKTKLDPAVMRAVKGVLGETTLPMAAWPTGCAIACVATRSARELCTAVVAACGDGRQVLVSEMGGDQWQWGYPEHHRWLDELKRLQGNIATSPGQGGNDR